MLAALLNLGFAGSGGDAEAPEASSYDITQNETITVTVPAVALTGSSSAVVAAPSFVISVDSATATGGGRGSKRTVSKYPRRIVIGGVVYWVKSAAEERRLLLEYRAKVEAEALELAITDAPAKEVAKAKVKVVRAARRLEQVDTREADWLEYLRQEDDEIVSVILH